MSRDIILLIKMIVGHIKKKGKAVNMKYDFESYIERKGLDAMAVEPAADSVYRKDIKLRSEVSDHIPMWIADMNFATYPGIQDAIAKRLAHPCFGYFFERDEYFDAIKYWQKKRNGIEGLEKENIGYENGVLGGVSSVLRTLLPKGGKVLVHSPCYVGFTHVFQDAVFTPVHSPLVKDGQGTWRMDFDNMEQLIKEHDLKVAIFCSPHNPTGRVWERWEIEKAMAIYQKYDMTVIADEIWSDLILDGNKHIPTQSVSEDAKNRVVAFYAPSKTFNLAGLIGSYHIIYNKELKEKIMETEKATFYNSMNVLSMYALIGGFTDGGMDWTDQLCHVLSTNASYAVDYIRKNLKGVEVSNPQGTYLIYIDCTEYLKAKGITHAQLQKRGLEAGVDWQNGEDFFVPNTFRLNLALPTARVKEAFDRLSKYVFM